MRKLLPVIVAALSIITICCFSTSAQARNETIKAARNKKPPSWNQYCYKVVYDAKKVKHKCRWREAEVLDIQSGAHDYTIKIKNQNSVTVKSSIPLYAEGIETPYRSFDFNVKGVGLPPTLQEIKDATFEAFGNKYNIFGFTTVLQIWNEAKGDWEFIDQGYGSLIESAATSLIEMLNLDFNLEGHVELMEKVKFRVGAVYYTNAHKPKTGKGYKGKPKPHYTFTPALAIGGCFGSEIFPDNEYTLTEGMVCQVAAEPTPAVDGQVIDDPEEPEEPAEESDGIDMTDTDGDTFRDEWEIQRGSDPNDPNSVPNNWDGDDASNSTEIACGSDPNDPESQALDNDIDCDDICDQMDPDDNDGPCGSADSEDDIEVDDETDTDLSDSDDTATLPTDDDGDRYSFDDPNETLSSEANGSSGGCSLNPQAASVNTPPLLMAFIAAISLTLIRRKR